MKMMIIAMSRLHKELWGRMGSSGSVVVMLAFALAFTQPIIRSAFSLLFSRSPGTIWLLESLQFVFKSSGTICLLESLQFVFLLESLQWRTTVVLGDIHHPVFFVGL